MNLGSPQIHPESIVHNNVWIGGVIHLMSSQRPEQRPADIFSLEIQDLSNTVFRAISAKPIAR